MSSILRHLRQAYLGRPGRVFIDTAKLFCTGHLFVSYMYSWGSVSGPSMLPGWEIWGEGAVVSHTYRYGRGVRVGDTVKFKVPISDDDAIKRVAGMPGDYVLVHTPETGLDEFIQVPTGHCWVLGDNLAASRDSRLYGPLPLSLIDGKVIYQTGEALWQLSRMKKIKNPFEEQRKSE